MRKYLEMKPSFDPVSSTSSVFLVKQHKQSRLFSRCLFSSITKHETKKVAANAQRKKILIDANAQNDARAGSADEDEIANATRSVREVTVMEAPARASARLPR